VSKKSPAPVILTKKLLLLIVGMAAACIAAAHGSVIIESSSLTTTSGGAINVGSSSPTIVDWGYWQGGLNPNNPKPPSNERSDGIIQSVNAMATGADIDFREDHTPTLVSFTFNNGVSPTSGTASLDGGFVNLNPSKGGWRVVLDDVSVQIGKQYTYTQYIRGVGAAFDLDVFNDDQGSDIVGNTPIDTYTNVAAGSYA